MLNIPSTMSIFLHTRPTDMRKEFDGLSGVMREAFGADPLDGNLFLFVNRRRDRLKILHFDGTGFWLYYRRLQAGASWPFSAANWDPSLQAAMTESGRAVNEEQVLDDLVTDLAAPLDDPTLPE